MYFRVFVIKSNNYSIYIDFIVDFIVHVLFKKAIAEENRKREEPNELEFQL